MFSAPCLQAPSLYVLSNNLRNQSSHPYRQTGGVTVLHILMSNVLLVVAVLVAVAVVISGQYYIERIYFTPDNKRE
jgi:hypothetical protein